jgi:hypothetical protein
MIRQLLPPQARTAIYLITVYQIIHLLSELSINKLEAAGTGRF